MHRLILIITLVVFSGSAYAGEKEHLMQVHGAVCPACAYGLEKKFMNIDGVKGFDVDFESGVVSVCTDENIEFEEEELVTLFKQSGYTYKGEEIRDTCTVPEKT
jgi:copper chaperone CopZ|tara:strand:+ start:166 stop:477 length:312 start_codon:yes stop_codon:yes gene_type:complete